MHRKVINNYRKSQRVIGNKKGSIGTELEIVDRVSNPLYVGDYVEYGKYKGILLYNPSSDEYGLALEGTMWYGDDKYNINSYGKFIALPLDNGAKMNLKKL